MPRVPTYTAPEGGPQVQFQGAPYHLPYPLDAAGLGQGITQVAEKYQDLQNRMDQQLDATEAVQVEALHAAGMKRIKNKVLTEPDSTRIDPATGETVVVPLDRRKMFGDLSRQLQQDVMGTIQRENVKGAFANYVQKTYPNEVVDMDIHLQKKQALDAFVGVQEVSDRYARLIADEPDPDEQKKLRDTFKDYMTSSLARGTITPEQRYQILKSTNEKAMERGMVNLGRDNPVALFNNAREGKYNDVDPLRREAILNQVQKQMEHQAAMAEADHKEFSRSQEEAFISKIYTGEDTPEMFDQIKRGWYPGIPPSRAAHFETLKRTVGGGNHDLAVDTIMMDYGAVPKLTPEGTLRAVANTRAELDQYQKQAGPEAVPFLRKAYDHLSSIETALRGEGRTIAMQKLQTEAYARIYAGEAVDATRITTGFGLADAILRGREFVTKAQMRTMVVDFMRQGMSQKEAQAEANKRILQPYMQQRQMAPKNRVDEVNEAIQAERSP